MKFKNILLALYLMSISSVSNASLITHNGYTLNTDTNIVTDGELEWLQWNKTAGNSVDEALTDYSANGWEVATTAQILALANQFGWGWTDIVANGFGSWGTPYTLDEDINNDLDLQFVELFGLLLSSSDIANSANYEPEGQHKTGAIFASTNTGKYKPFFMRDDYTVINGNKIGGAGGFGRDNMTNTSSQPGYGVALVRTVIDVPEPSLVALFSLALISLFRIRKS